MAWLRDGAKAFVWAAGALLLAFGLLRTGIFSGLTPLTLPLVLVPVAAHRWHRAPRLTLLVIAWEVVLLAAAGLALAWSFRDFHFRATQG